MRFVSGFFASILLVACVWASPSLAQTEGEPRIIADPQVCYESGAAFSSCGDRWLNPSWGRNGPGYDAGVFLGIVLGVALAEDGRTYCPSSHGLNEFDLARAVARFLRAHPQLAARERPGALTRRALQSIAPCARKTGTDLRRP